MSDDRFTAHTDGIHADANSGAFEKDGLYFMGLLGILVVACLLMLLVI